MKKHLNIASVGIFIGLNLMDVVLTNHLVALGVAVEGNPIAAMFIDDLLAFKCVMVSITLFALFMISRINVKVANRVLNYGNFAVGLVVMYSTIITLATNSLGV